MVTQPVSQYIVVKFNLKNKADATDTKSAYVANYPLNTNDGTDDYYVVDLIDSISSLGEEVGDTTSKTSSASISINSKRNSAGFQRRLVDLFDAYTAINQEVTIYYYESTDAPENIFALESAFTEAYTGVVKDVSWGIESCRVTVQQFVVSNEYVNYILPPYEDYFNEQAVGATAPLLIGEEVVVKPKVFVNSANATLAYQLIATEGDAFYMTGTARLNDVPTAFSLYTVDDNGGALVDDFVRVRDTDSVYQKQYDPGSGAKCYSSTGSGTQTMTSSKQYFIPIRAEDLTNSTQLYSINGFRIRVKGTSGVGAAILDVGITERRANDNYPKLNTMLSSKVSVATGTSYTDLYIYLDTPYITNADSKYYVSIKMEAVISTDLQLSSGHVSGKRYVYDHSAESWSTTTDTNRISGDVFACHYVSGTYNPYNDLEEPVVNGKSCHYLQVYSPAGTATNRGDLDIICSVEGYNDGAGTFYDSPVSAAKYLLKEYDSDTGLWGDSANFSDSYFSDSHDGLTDYPRVLNGAITKKYNAKKAIIELCSETVSKFIYKNNKWGVYTHGASLDNAFYLYDKDILDFNYSVKDRSTIVNSASIAYQRNLENVDYTNVFIENRWYSYLSSLTMAYNDGDIGELISSESEAIYSKSDKTVEDYNLIYDADSIEQILKLFLSLHVAPREFIDVTVPYIDFKDIEIMDAGYISSAYLPSNFGSAISPNDYVYTDTSGDNHSCDIIGGTEITRNQGVKVQVYKKQLQLNKKDQPATLKLTLKVNNHHGGIW